MQFNQLQRLVLEWADKKGILTHGNPVAQCLKTVEEVFELQLAVENKDRKEIIDGIGDVLVTIIIQAEMHGLKIEECLEVAYNVINQRSGKMVNGTFVKDE